MKIGAAARARVAPPPSPDLAVRTISAEERCASVTSSRSPAQAMRSDPTRWSASPRSLSCSVSPLCQEPGSIARIFPPFPRSLGASGFGGQGVAQIPQAPPVPGEDGRVPRVAGPPVRKSGTRRSARAVVSPTRSRPRDARTPGAIEPGPSHRRTVRRRCGGVKTSGRIARHDRYPTLGIFPGDSPRSRTGGATDACPVTRR